MVYHVYMLHKYIYTAELISRSCGRSVRRSTDGQIGWFVSPLLPCNVSVNPAYHPLQPLMDTTQTTTKIPGPLCAVICRTASR